MTRQTYLRLAECHNNNSASTEEIARCAQRYSQPLQQGQNVLNAEMQAFQERLQRCVQSCQDDAQVSQTQSSFSWLGGGSQQSSERKMITCVNTCADKHLAQLQQIKIKVGKDLDDLAKHL